MKMTLNEMHRAEIQAAVAEIVSIKNAMTDENETASWERIRTLYQEIRCVSEGLVRSRRIRDRSKYTPHASTREMARRARS